MENFQLPKKVLSREGDEIGTTTGGTRRCTMEGCQGVRIGVRWPDGKLTWPCSKGMTEVTEEEWRIR